MFKFQGGSHPSGQEEEPPMRGFLPIPLCFQFNGDSSTSRIQLLPSTSLLPSWSNPTLTFFQRLCNSFLICLLVFTSQHSSHNDPFKMFHLSTQKSHSQNPAIANKAVLNLPLLSSPVGSAHSLNSMLLCPLPWGSQTPSLGPHLWFLLLPIHSPWIFQFNLTYLCSNTTSQGVLL